jgi:hypothetical protein
MNRSTRVTWLAVLFLLIGLVPCAQTLEIGGTGSRGAFQGTLQVRCGEDGRQAVLTLELTNSTSPGDGLTITGWYLNNPGGTISAVAMADSVFALLGGPVFRNSIDASPAGYYDIGAAASGEEEAAGKNSAGAGSAAAGESTAGDGHDSAGRTADCAGIAAGRSRRFQLVLRGTDLKSLDADRFAGEAPEGGEHFLAVRFQGPAAGEIEIVPAGPVSQPEAVVTPAAASSVPRGYALQPNYPNPFNASTNIGFRLPAGGHVSLTIYDVLGRTARHLVDQHQEAGNYIARWDGRDDRGKVMKSGVYFCVFEAGSCRETIKMVLSR